MGLDDSSVQRLSIDDYEGIRENSRGGAAIIIPPDVVDNAGSENIALTIYQDDALFVPADDDEYDGQDGEGKSEGVNETIGTNVIAASIGRGGETIQKLKTPITISLAHKLVSNIW